MDFWNHMPSFHNKMDYFLSYGALIFAVACLAFALIVPLLVPRKKDIRGQRILITGAGHGVGRQLSIEFSKHDTSLILTDINRQWLLETEKLLDHRSSVFIYDCDVSDYKKVYEMANKVKEEVGDVDILVNNAGIVSGKYLMDLPEERIIKTMEVNALAHFWTCKAFLPAMMEKNRGHVVSVASIMGKNVGPRLSDYCASKFAAVGFAESLEMEMREKKLDGIKVTIVCPSHIDTGLFQGASANYIGSIMTPQFVAKEIVKAVLEEKEIIYLPRIVRYGSIIKEILPRWLVIKCYELTGNLKAMEHFTGRQMKDVTANGKTL